MPEWYKKRILQRPGQEVQLITERPSEFYQLEVPDFKIPTVTNLEDSIMTGLENRKRKDAYNQAYNEYLEQHPISPLSGIGYNPYIGIQYNPQVKQQQAAHNYAVEESGYIGDKSTSPYKNVDAAFGAASAIGVSMIPLLGASFGTFGVLPKLASDAYFGYEGAKDLISPEGVAKTINFAKQGRGGRAILSGMGDLFDLTLARQGLKGIKTLSAFAKETPYVARFNWMNRKGSFRMEYPWQRTPETLPERLTLEHVAEDQTPKYNFNQLSGLNRRSYQSPVTSQLGMIPQIGFAKSSDIRYAMSENGLEGVRQRWLHTIIHPNHFYGKPDLEYAGIPKGDRNFKFRTMKFRMTPGESEAARLWSQKRNIWDRYKTVTKRRGLEFNEYDEPLVPVVSSVADTRSFDDPIFAQSNLVKVFQQYGGKNLLNESELKFKPEELQQGWIDYFNSPQYRERVRQNSGLSEPEIDRFINEMITNMKSAHHTYMTLPQIVEKKVPTYNPATGDFSIRTVLAQGSEGGHYEPNRHLVVINNSRGKNTPVNFEHEDLHATLRRGTYPREVLDKSGLINGTVLNQTNGIRGMFLPGKQLMFSNGLVEKPSFAQKPFNRYLAGRDEARVRGLKILRYLDEHNLPITEENVGKALDEMDAYDANQLSAFTRESVIDYLKRLYVLPLAVGLGATAVNKNQNK